MFSVTPFWGFPGKLASRNSMEKRHDIRCATKTRFGRKWKRKIEKEQGRRIGQIQLDLPT